MRNFIQRRNRDQKVIDRIGGNGMTLHVGAGNPAPLALLALKHRLFNSLGGLKSELMSIVDDPKGATISILQSDEVPYGVCVITIYNQVMIFVDPKVRGYGWGQRLVECALAVDSRAPNIKDVVFAMPGNDFLRSVQFWEKCGIRCVSSNSGHSLTSEEGERMIRDGFVLVSRRASDVYLDVFEDIYIRRLYDPQPADEQNGLKGQLAAIWNENLTPFDHLFFHLHDGCQSFATIRLRQSDQLDKIAELQLYVAPDCRRRGWGQEIIDATKSLYPEHRLVGYYNPHSSSLLERNGVDDVSRHKLHPWTSFVRFNVYIDHK